MPCPVLGSQVQCKRNRWLLWTLLSSSTAFSHLVTITSLSQSAGPCARLLQLPSQDYKSQEQSEAWLKLCWALKASCLLPAVLGGEGGCHIRYVKDLAVWAAAEAIQGSRRSLGPPFRTDTKSGAVQSIWKKTKNTWWNFTLVGQEGLPLVLTADSMPLACFSSLILISVILRLSLILSYLLPKVT